MPVRVPLELHVHSAAQGAVSGPMQAGHSIRNTSPKRPLSMVFIQS